MNGVIHILENVIQHRSEIDLGPLAVVAAIVPGLQPVAALASAEASLLTDPGKVLTNYLKATVIHDLTAGGPIVANGGGTDLGALEAPPIVPGPGGYYGSAGTDVPSATSPPDPFASVTGLIGTVRGALQTVRGLLSGGTSGTDVSVANIGGDVGIGGAVAGALGALGKAFPAIESVVPRLLLRAAPYAAVATSIYEVYKALRARGLSHQSAKTTSLRVHGIMRKRRRMRATNIRALRRAVRRVRSFRRIAGKVRGVLGHQRGGWMGSRRRRRYRRGDVPPFAVEDRLDYQDEAEDLDLEEDGELAYE